jgi:hypothetical protein
MQLCLFKPDAQLPGQFTVKNEKRCQATAPHNVHFVEFGEAFV